jgi:septal ring factor EnvC (AmiA/AmiB activator)
MTKRLLTIVISTFLLICIIMSPIQAYAQVSDVERKQLEAELVQLQAEIDQKQKELDSQRKNSASLSTDVSVLEKEIAKAKLQITAKNKTLQQLSGQIVQKNKTIETLDEKRTRQENSLSQILRKKDQMDASTLAEILLSKKTLSGFLGEVDNLQAINEGIQESFGIIKSTKQKTSQEKEQLEEKKNQENDVKYQLGNRQEKQ